MRPELNDIESIERYLSGQMSAEEKAAFETRLAADPGLRENLRLHQDLMKGLDRIQQIRAVRRARLNYHRRIWLKWGGAGLGGLILITGLILLATFRHRAGAHSGDHGVRTPSTIQPPTTQNDTTAQPVPGQPTYRHDTLPAVDETGQARWSSADSALSAQTFWLAATRDTVIETAGGIVLSIPASAFLDADHRPVTGTVELVVKEALDAASMLKAGLSTCAGDQLLETGGMFYLDARQNGQPIVIDTGHAIYAEVPTDSVRPGMQLFTGNRLAGGVIDWTDPQPLDHDLLPVDIHSLNFYPPHYLDSVAGWGYDAGNKTFTDSLYFSFAALFHSVKSDSMGGTRPSDSVAASCAIDPARIAAIWNDHFQNTLIATREFGQRLTLIHQTGDSNLLNLYVDHLDWNLSAIDSTAATETTGEIRRRFLAFAGRHDGKVRHGDARFDKLREYYRIKAKTFGDAVVKTRAEFQAKEQQLDSTAASRAVQHGKDSVDRLNRNFAAELAVNFRSACRQLGYHYRIDQRGSAITLTEFGNYPPGIIAPAGYHVNVTKTGWCNIDKYVLSQTLTRRNIDYRDSTTGKRAVITYSSVFFKFTDITEYDRVYLYLLPDKLNSFIRLTDSAGVFTDKLNSEMTYRLLVIGYQQQQAFYYKQTNIQPTTYTPIPLIPISDTDLQSRLEHLGKATQVAAVKEDQEYFRYEAHDRPRRDRDQQLRDLTNKMIHGFFPCIMQESPESSGPPPGSR